MYAIKVAVSRQYILEVMKSVPIPDLPPARNIGEQIGYLLDRVTGRYEMDARPKAAEQYIQDEIIRRVHDTVKQSGLRVVGEPKITRTDVYDMTEGLGAYYEFRVLFEAEPASPAGSMEDVYPVPERLTTD